MSCQKVCEARTVLLDNIYIRFALSYTEKKSWYSDEH